MISFLPFEGTQISYRHCGRTSVEEEEEEESMSMSSRMEARKTHTKGRERNQRKQLLAYNFH